MFRKKIPHKPTALTLLLVPGFAMLPFSGVVECMRLANSFSRKELYRWQVASMDGRPVAGANGIPVSADIALNDVCEPENLMLCGGLHSHKIEDPSLLAALRKFARQGALIGAICTGSHILAKAGLLNGHRCTIHAENRSSLREEFPDLDVRDSLYELDRNRLTSAGGATALDMVLAAIREEHGGILADRIAAAFLMGRVRPINELQSLPDNPRARLSPPQLKRAIREMERHTEETLTRSELAERACISQRQLERLFRQHLTTSPIKYYTRIRLKKAHGLLTQTDMPIIEIAMACGFATATQFTKSYRLQFGRTPGQVRKAPEQNILSC